MVGQVTALLFALGALVGLLMLGYWLWSGRNAKVQAARAKAAAATANTNATANALAAVNKQIGSNRAKSDTITALMLVQHGEEQARQRKIMTEGQDVVDDELLRRGLTRDK